MRTEEILQNLGLSKWESAAYLALLELGPTTTGPLVKRSSVPQSKVYGVLDALMRRGMASYAVKGKTKHFQAGDPLRLLATFKEQERLLEKGLKALQVAAKGKQSVELYQGLPALRSLFAAMIDDARRGEDFYGFSTGAYPEQANEFYHWWGRRKSVAELKDRLLISSGNKAPFLASIAPEDRQAVSKKTRYCELSFPGDVAIFRESVVILNWETEPTGILIESERLAAQYRRFFLELWNSSMKR